MSASSRAAEFRRPLGLALSAGGALGSWQASALRALEREGLEFDRVLGVSAGALNGAAYALGLGDEIEERWKRVDKKILRFSPRLFPFSLFSEAPLFGQLEFCADDAEVKKRLRRPLAVVTARADRSRRDYAVFEPGGRRWDGPLQKRLVTSCAIPWVFPTVVHEGLPGRHLDGSVRCDEPYSFEGLAGCKDVVVLEPVRADELSRTPRGFLDEIDLRARQTIRLLMSQGTAGLRASEGGPRVFRLAPSRMLEFSMLTFAPDSIAEGLRRGREDAAAFLGRPEAALAV